MSGGARGMGRLLLGAPAAMAGPTRRGVSVTVTARAALHSRSPTPPAATRKRAGTCPGRRSPRCCSWRCPGWGPPAWAACPAGERATGQSGTSAARRPHLQLPRTATPPAWMPGHAPTPLMARPRLQAPWGSSAGWKVWDGASPLSRELASPQVCTASGRSLCLVKAEPGRKVDKRPTGGRPGWPRARAQPHDARNAEPVPHH